MLAKILTRVFGWNLHSTQTAQTEQKNNSPPPQVTTETRHGRVLRISEYNASGRRFGRRMEAIVELTDGLADETVTVDHASHCCTTTLLREGDRVLVVVTREVGFRYALLQLDLEALVPTDRRTELPVGQSYKRKGTVLRHESFDREALRDSRGFHREGGATNAFVVEVDDEFGKEAVVVEQLARLGGSSIRIGDPVILTVTVPSSSPDRAVSISLDAEAMARV